MGCTHLCDKKSQKSEDFKIKTDKTQEDVLLSNINEPDNLNPVLINENIQKSNNINKIENKKDDVVIINIAYPNNLNMVLNSGLVSGNLRDYLYLLGKHFSNMEEFLIVHNDIFQLIWKLPTTFYTLNYENVKK